MRDGNIFKIPFEGDGERRMLRGSVERAYSTRRIAAISLWDSDGVIRGSMNLPIRNLEGVQTIRSISGFVLWVEMVYPNETSPYSDCLGISSIEKAEYTPEGIDPDYFS